MAAGLRTQSQDRLEVLYAHLAPHLPVDVAEGEIEERGPEEATPVLREARHDHEGQGNQAHGPDEAALADQVVGGGVGVGQADVEWGELPPDPLRQKHSKLTHVAFSVCAHNELLYLVCKYLKFKSNHDTTAWLSEPITTEMLKTSGVEMGSPLPSETIATLIELAEVVRGIRKRRAREGLIGPS